MNILGMLLLGQSPYSQRYLMVEMAFLQAGVVEEDRQTQEGAAAAAEEVLAC